MDNWWNGIRAYFDVGGAIKRGVNFLSGGDMGRDLRWMMPRCGGDFLFCFLAVYRNDDED